MGSKVVESRVIFFFWQYKSKTQYVIAEKKKNAIIHMAFSLKFILIAKYHLLKFHGSVPAEILGTYLENKNSFLHGSMLRNVQY